MKIQNLIGGFAALVLCSSCAASGSASATADDYSFGGEEAEAEERESAQLPGSEHDSDDPGAPGSHDEPDGAKLNDGSSPPQPAFTPGMSVAEATEAIPNSAEFSGLDVETLSRPLHEPEIFAPCKLKPHHHFTLKVAVWDGRAVGVDVKSTNKSLAVCVAEQVREQTWPQRVKSLNTVDYKY